MPEIMSGQPMEEILASIKRIIAEDAPLSFAPPTLGGAPARAEEPAEDVLELEEPTTPPATAHVPIATEAEPEPAPEPFTHAPDPAFTVHEAHVPAPEEAIAAAPPPDYVQSAPTLGTPEPQPNVTSSAPAPVANEPVSGPEPAAPLDPAIVAAALDPDPGYESLLSASAEAASRQALAALNTLTIDSRAAPNTLDGMVREMLRPLLAEWLDTHLPPIVEQMVAREIKRLGRG